METRKSVRNQLRQVTIHAQQANIQVTKQISPEIVALMVQANYITLEDVTIEKEAVRVDEYGNVTFYGLVISEGYFDD